MFLWISCSFGKHFCTQDASNNYHCHLITSSIKLFHLAYTRLLVSFIAHQCIPDTFFETIIIQKTACQLGKQLTQSPDLCCTSIHQFSVTSGVLDYDSQQIQSERVLKRFSFQLCMPHYHTFSEAESTLQGESQKRCNGKHKA